MGSRAKVYVSSRSSVKHAAVKRAFAQMGIEAQISGFEVDSGVTAQPLSFEETHAGARNRHSRLKKLTEGSEGYRVTLESGLVRPVADANWKGCEVAIVESSEGKQMTGFDLGLEYPQSMLDKVPSKYPDLGILMQEEYGFKEKDPPTFLSGGRISRADLITQALFKVLAQMDVKI